MSQRVLVVYYDPAGIQHDAEVRGHKLVATVRRGIATVKRYDEGGRCSSTFIWTGVAGTEWHRDSEP